MIPGRPSLDSDRRLYEITDDIYQHSARKTRDAERKFKGLALEGRDLNSDLEVVN